MSVVAYSAQDCGLENDLAWKIFLDRYTLKDLHRAFEVGDIAVVQTNDDPKWPKKEIARTLEAHGETVVLQLLTGEAAGETLEASRVRCDRPLERTVREVADRVAAAIALVEPKDRAKHAAAFAEEIAALRLVPGGRVWAGAGSGVPLTLFNCYVVPNPSDSRQGIIETLGQMIEIMARGGGVGINVSTLRPYRAPVKGVNGRSSGAVSWMDIYSRATGLVEQGGCFGPSVRIATDHGLIPAAELADRLEAGEALSALTHEGPRALTWAFRNGSKPLLRVITERGFEVEVTPDHRMGVLRDGRLTTVPLRDLDLGDEVLLLLGERQDGGPVHLSPAMASAAAAPDLPEALTPDLAYVLGHLHGRGRDLRGPDGEVAIAVDTVDAPAGARLAGRVRRVFGLETPLDGHCVTVRGTRLLEWLRRNGLWPEGAGAPEPVLRAGAEVQGAFLAGCMDATAAGRGRRRGCRLDSDREPLLRDLQRILAANGILARLEGPRPDGLHRLSVVGAEFRARLAAFAGPPASSPRRSLRRDVGRGYPRAVWRRLGVPGVFSQGIWDPRRPTISYRALTRVRGRLAAAGQVALATRVGEVLHQVPDRIVSLEFVGMSEVFDFEVSGTHMLSGGGLYTSNSRRGALMLQMEIWHPDVWRFIGVKQQKGMVENANISLRITDDFMEAVKAGGAWDLVFPDTEDPAYDTQWNGDLAAWRAAEHRVVVYETVPAQHLWKAITDSAWKCAEPGIVFSERHEKDSNSWYFNPLICTNPCVTGDTLIHTGRGLRRAAEMWASGDPAAVLTDGRFASPTAFTQASAVFRTGFQSVVKVRTREGYEVRVTPDHRLYSEARGWTSAAELRTGEVVRVANGGGGFGAEGTRDEGAVLGWLVGDGHFTSERAVLSFYGEERQQLAPTFASAVNTVIRPGRIRAYAPVGVVDVPARGASTIASSRLREFAVARGVTSPARPRVPEPVWTGSREMQAGFLQALFEADGYVETERGPRPGVRLSARSRELLVDVQRLLLNFGIFSRIQRARGGGAGGGGWRTVRLHVRAPRHEMTISGASARRFDTEVGFLGERKRAELTAFVDSYARGPYREHFLARVESVAEDGAEWVYDLTEPVTHSFVANGLVVHNCAEQPLPAWGVCTLGHVNLARMVAPSGRDVNWEQLGRTVRRGVRFLDDVVDATPYFFEENRENQRLERRIGLGTLGLAELMIRLGHRYGHPDAEPFLHHLFSFIRDEAYLASAELAAEKGVFPAFDAERYLQSGFCRRLPEGVRGQIRQHGIRNVTLLTQAPTGTTGTMVNTSTGIEPFFSFKFFRQSRLGFDEQWVPLAEEWLQAHPGQDLPGHFVSAMQLSPEDHIRVQAVVQTYTDSSISKTANAPHDYTTEQTAELYLLAYETGCKGVTIYRDGSRDEQVLHDASAAADQADDAVAATPAPPAAQVSPSARPRPDVIRGQTVRMAAPEGTVFITLNEHPDGTPFEIFARAGKAGSDLTASVDAIARLASLALRSGISPEAVVDQLEGIGGRTSVGFGPKRVRSVADAIAKAMQQVWLGEGRAEQPRLPGPADALAEQAATVAAGAAHQPAARSTRRGDLCPACGEYSILYQEGCVTCSNCGHSEC